jgi:NodT family efflux transporter outer membrane factor (OMF) lipoprotein
MRSWGRFVRSGLVAGACVLAAGCVPSLQGNEPREPNKKMPGSFASGSGGAKSSKAGTSGSIQWETFFTDPELRQLIETALENNQELNIRLQDIIIAQNEAAGLRGAYLPKLGVGGGVGLDKPGKYTSRGQADEATGVPTPTPDFRFGFEASWEVDVWGKLHNAAKAAAYRYLASIEGKNFVVTRLVAEIARSYYELIALDSQLEILNKFIEIMQNALEIVRLQKQAARVTELAVQRFEAEVLKNQSRQFALQQKIIQTENKINFLVGRLPQPVARNSAHFKDRLPRTISAGVPTYMLRNRPDVRQAELLMKAAKMDVKAAKKEFYPSLNIEAGVGYDAFNPSHIVDTPDSLFYNLMGNLTAPLLNRKAIKARYRMANAMQLQAVYNYERTLLQGYTDVANQLAMIKNLQESYKRMSRQVDILTSAIDVSNTLFQSARADYMEVLLTRRDALEAEMQLIETKLKQFLAMVNVYQALGGGWR